MIRREFLALLGVTPVFAAAGSGTAHGQGVLTSTELAESARNVWAAWKNSYMRLDGRVVDGYQQDASHSEGQGYGALLATEFNDQEAFDKIYQWTEANLSLRGDGLLSWRYLPEEANPVPDLNNASDGDLFYAWALVRASQRFGNRALIERATRTARALVEQCIVPSPQNPAETLFLPGAVGFVHENRVIFNPSYIMPLAMREVAVATGVPELAQAAQHAEGILLRLAQDGLVPDWVAVTPDGMGPAEDFSQNAGYESMRVPLYLIWSGLNRHPAVIRAQQVYTRAVQPGVPVPTVIEPASGTVIEASNDPGYRAVAALVTCAGGAGEVGSAAPPFNPAQPYYPATLQMFAMLAANQVIPECVPI